MLRFCERHRTCGGKALRHAPYRQQQYWWGAWPVKWSWLAIFLALSAAACRAQITEYHNYPQTRGQIEQFQTPLLPDWLQLDGGLRGRLGGQAALGTNAQKGAAYLMPRVRGGARITPVPALQLYLQFQDTHAPGLSPRLTSAN